MTHAISVRLDPIDLMTSTSVFSLAVACGWSQIGRIHDTPLEAMITEMHMRKRIDEVEEFAQQHAQ